MRTILRDNYNPEVGDYHESLVVDEVNEKIWLFDCDGVFTKISSVKVVSQFGDSEEFAASQKLVTEVHDDLITEVNERKGADNDIWTEVGIINGKIEALATDFSYKGSVADYAHLPSDAATGDCYTTLDTGIIYVWDGTQWVALNEYPSVFVGTDGTNPGTEGLVPAPTAADADKVLSANGGWVDNDNFYDVKVSTRTDKTYRELKTAWEAGKVLRFGSSQGVFWFWQKGNGSSSTFPITFASKKHYLYTLQGEVTYEGTGVPAVIMLELHMNSTGSDWEDQPLRSSTEPIANLQPAGLDATTPDYKIPSITVLKNALAEREPVTIVNAGAPTTSTAAVGVGQQYYDSTNNKLYYCSAITAQGTDPETYTYTWVELATSSSVPTVVQTTGDSTTSVMSQDATSRMIFRTRGAGYPWDPTYYVDYINIGGKDTQTTVLADGWGINIGGYGNGGTSRQISDASVTIGHGTYTAGRGDVIIGNPASTGINSNLTNSVVIGNGAGPSGSGASLYRNSLVTIGYNAQVPTQSITGAISIGAYSYAQANGEMNIGSTNTTYGYNSSNYRLLTGLYDPQSAHDAATKGYVDTAVSGAVATINSTDWSALWQ